MGARIMSAFAVSDAFAMHPLRAAPSSPPPSVVPNDPRLDACPANRSDLDLLGQITAAGRDLASITG